MKQYNGANTHQIHYVGMLNYAKNEMMGDWGFQYGQRQDAFKIGNAVAQKIVYDIYGRPMP